MPPIATMLPVLRIDPAALDLPAELLRTRRDRFLGQLGEGVAILCAAPELQKSRDTGVRYRQDSDLYYLTGFPEPGAVALFTPHDPEHRFTLFVRPRDPEREVWHGTRVGPEGAREHYAADAAYPIEELDEHLRKLVEPADRIFYALGSNVEMDRRVVELLVHFRRGRQRAGRGPTDVADPGTILDGMRLIKEPLELERLRLAARLSAEGHRAAMQLARPGIGEWELEAALDAVFRAGGGMGPAYPSIVASGPGATVLHYVANNRRAREGELVLIDAGAEVGMYAGDISRTFPVSGRFTPAQRCLYEIVLAAENAAIAEVRPGAAVTAPHDAAVRTLVAGMLEVGLLEGEADELIEEEKHKRYFMHNSSHWLGLDVHDVGLYKREGEPVPLEPGMVLTVEPGLYISEHDEEAPAELRGIGIRIEDDVVVTDTGCELLTRDVPVEVEEVEALVGSGRRA
ncbi:MAG TPA: aminopeptidase P N-terminal domain-containing protein [Longimicrobiaceae bacterium]|nr:aminopeptidase P N-terminal domain-containing protein [Longimicrobiaceae bacterium]